MEQSGQGRFSFPRIKEGIGEAIPFASADTLCVTGNFNIYYTLTGTFLADGFKISSAVFAQRADIIIRQLIAFIDESANLADKSFLPSVSGFGFTLFW